MSSRSPPQHPEGFSRDTGSPKDTESDTDTDSDSGSDLEIAKEDSILDVTSSSLNATSTSQTNQLSGPLDARAAPHQRRDSQTTDLDMDSYYSLESGAPSTVYHSVQRPPTVGGSSHYANSNQQSSQASSRPLHMQGTISSIKIVFPEEIYLDHSFGDSTDERSSTSRAHQARMLSDHTGPSRSLQSEPTQDASSTSQEVPDKGMISNTRLTTNDTKMIININTSSDTVGSVGRKSSIAHSASSINAINDKNQKFVKRMDTQNGNVNTRKPSFRLGSGLKEEAYAPFDEDTENMNGSTKSGRKGRSVSLAVNGYANLENTQGFVGALALAFAAAPGPEALLRRGSDFFDADHHTPGQHTIHPTPAADVNFHREHTRKQIFKRRMKGLKYLTKEYLKLSLKFVRTWKGFFITVYFLLVVAFGGMLFLLLCNAAPAMSREWGPDDKVHSPRQIWLEIDSQVINALFCITGLGLFPLRCRDMYLWIRGRYMGDIYCNAKILKIHSNWFWSGFTSDGKLLLVVVLYIMNSVFQVLLCFVMWHFNRFTRPSWTTGLLIAASFSCVIVAGVVMFVEAKRIKTYCFQTGVLRQVGHSFNPDAHNADEQAMAEDSAEFVVKDR